MTGCATMLNDAERHICRWEYSRKFNRTSPYQRYKLQHDGKAIAMIFIHPCRNWRFTIQFAMEEALGGIRFISSRESLREFALVISLRRIGNNSRSSFSSGATPPPSQLFFWTKWMKRLGKYSRRRHSIIPQNADNNETRKAHQIIQCIVFKENIEHRSYKKYIKKCKEIFCNVLKMHPNYWAEPRVELQAIPRTESQLQACVHKLFLINYF